MARIAAAELERLKRDIAVERLVAGAGIALKRAGQDLLGRCPFHADAEASLVVTPGKNLWHCFGCQQGGGPIDWVMRQRGVSFRHAVELLREGGPSLAAESPPVQHSTVRTLPAPVTREADDQALLNQVIGYYHETLKQSPEALAYLQARGLDHSEAITTFRLGFANRTLGLRLPEKNRVAGAELRTRLQQIGIYRASGHEHFNGSLVIPILDEHGNVSEVYGRKVTDNLRPGTPSHLYLPGAQRTTARGVWNLAALQASAEIILCEALLDALTFWCAGYRNVTASYGIEGFTADHRTALQKYGTQRVLIAYDRDQPGERAAMKLADELMAAGIECWRIQFPKGMDANDYARKVTPAAKSLGIAIRKAVWLGKGKAPERATTLPIEIAPAEVLDASPLAAKEEPVTTLPASPLPPAPVNEAPAQVREHEVVMAFGERRYRVRGLNKNLAYAVLKVNVLVSLGERVFVDTLDLYAAKARASFVTQAAIELQIAEDILKADLGRLLLELERLQDAQIRQATTPPPPAAVTMAEDDRRAALALLRDPQLLERILADFETCGLIGERTNKLVGYLATVSRKLDRPLGVVIQSSSAAGKTTLLDALLAFVPTEERVKYSALTGQALFYLGETNLQHKVLALVEEEGASRASYALKLLQSEGELTIASTGKDPTTGNLVTQEYRVQGPVALLLTTTARDLDEELLNRCLVLAVDEGRVQTAAIHRVQRERRTLAGLLAEHERAALLDLHRNAQRLLRPLTVLNPYAAWLTFPDQTTRLRRDHEKYLTLIDTLALLHQYQREGKTTTRAKVTIEYLEVSLADIELANQLAHEVLGRSLDELPPQTRRLLRLIDRYVAAECERQGQRRSDFRFSRRQLREALQWGDTQLKVHLARLVEFEYVLAHRVAHGAFAYELIYETTADDGSARVPGLIDVATLQHRYDAQRSGSSELRSGSSRPAVGVRSVAGRDHESRATPSVARNSEDTATTDHEMHCSRGNGEDLSYPDALPLAAAVAG
jgi:DNA primase catalytic core